MAMQNNPGFSMSCPYCPIHWDFGHESIVFFEYPTDLSSLCCVAKRLVYRETWGRRTETRVDSERDNSYRLF